MCVCVCICECEYNAFVFLSVCLYVCECVCMVKLCVTFVTFHKNFLMSEVSTHLRSVVVLQRIKELITGVMNECVCVPACVCVCVCVGRNPQT